MEAGEGKVSYLSWIYLEAEKTRQGKLGACLANMVDRWEREKERER